LVREIRHVVGGKVNWVLMWSLARSVPEKLISQAGLQHWIARELGIVGGEAKEILWRLDEGNTRALKIIWRLKKWLGRSL